MRVLFCSDPLNPRMPDEAYDREVAAVSSLEISYSLVHFEPLVYENDVKQAVRRVEPSEIEETTVYRGWMLTPEQYTRLYEALTERGVRLINSPASYRHCHYLPESYSVIEGYTPRTVWMPAGADISIDRVMELLTLFGSNPVIVKDYVKSQKHKWAEACFIPSAADRETVEPIVRRFLQLQGDDLNEGLVFREYVEFEPLGRHSKSGMPLTKEWRIFYLDGEPLLTADYWEEGEYGTDTPSLEPFSALALQVHSRFFTMDIARRKDGNYMIMELGDGQVAGLPQQADVTAFYASLRSRLRNGTSF